MPRKQEKLPAPWNYEKLEMYLRTWAGQKRIQEMAVETGIGSATIIRHAGQHKISLRVRDPQKNELVEKIRELGATMSRPQIALALGLTKERVISIVAAHDIPVQVDPKVIMYRRKTEDSGEFFNESSRENWLI